MRLTEEHKAIAETTRQFIEKELNPYCDQWEEEGIFPAHEVFKKMGKLGLLGIAKPVEYGGMGLDYSYQVVFSEELGTPEGKERLGELVTAVSATGKQIIVGFVESAAQMQSLWTISGINFLQGIYMQAPSENIHLNEE